MALLPTTLESILRTSSIPVWPLFLLAASGVLIWMLCPDRRLKNAPYLEAPRTWYGLPKDYNRYIEEGYRQFRDSIFSVPTDSGPLLILPKKFIDEVRVLPDVTASFRKSFEFWFLNEHTNIGGDGTYESLLKATTDDQVDQHQVALINAAKRHLTKHGDLSKLLAAVQEELDYAFATEMPQNDDWNEVKIYPIMIRVVARLIARVFVGTSLCRDTRYPDISITYTVNCLRVSRLLAWCPWLLRPLFKYITPGYLDLRTSERSMRRLLQPEIEKRLRQDPKQAKAEDLLQWSIDESDAKQKNDSWFLAISQINASLAAIHSTAIVATNAIFDAATRPEYIQLLRHEAMGLSSDSVQRPEIDVRLLALPKLDSFLKESQRMNPLGLIGVMRMSTSNITLSDGTQIPHSSQFAFAMKSMSYDESVWERPEQFDGLRFERLAKQTATADNNWNFVSSNKSSYSFGYGSHACPGRHFAAVELKIILANFLLQYDVESDGVMEYKTGVRGFMFLPDVDKTLSLRRRNVIA